MCPQKKNSSNHIIFVLEKKVKMNYEWLSGKDHVLQRPDTYVGPISITEIKGHVFTKENDKISCKNEKCEASPALFKMFDEVIVNAIDNHKRDPSQKYIKASIDENGVFTVINDGTTIPISLWKDTKRYIIEILLFELMSGENFHDDREKVGGRNGLGVKIVNILSDWLEVSIVNVEDGFKYKQIFKSNASIAETPVIKKIGADDKKSSTCIKWKPDYKRLNMTIPLEESLINLLKSRMYDAAACTSQSVAVFFNKEKLTIKSMKDYALAFGGQWIGRDEICVENDIVFDFCLTTSQEPGKCIGFVNGLQCSSGTHVELVYRKLIESINDILKKKLKRTCSIRPQQVKDAFNIILGIRLKNPSFSSQTKEKLDTRIQEFGFTYNGLSALIIRHLEKSSVIDNFVQAAHAQEDKDVQKSVQQTKKQKQIIPKYQKALKTHANLYITEGDSAMAMAISGFSVIGREHNGVFPLRGKVVNVYGMSAKKALEHKEIMYLTQILGLEPNKQYDTANVRNLPYRHIVIFTDQDTDGSHIMGLVLTFIREYFSSLLNIWPDFVQRFATPIVKAQIGTEKRSFFSMSEYKTWCGDRQPKHVKYYKGLGTSTDEEAREYFNNITEHKTNVMYTGEMSEEAISTFYAPDKSEKRKEALKQIDENSCVNYKEDQTTFEEFCYNELIHHCAADNDRSIANAIDGLKPSQRKILDTTLSRSDKKEIKVAALAASTTELKAYHHGEQSLISAIMQMAQTHIGTNNIAYLVPKGQFGSRLEKRDAGLAAPRYVFTLAANITRFMFRVEDKPVLQYAEDDGMQIEPKYFVPIIASVLINGCEGIGTGYKTSIPNFNPKDVIRQTKQIVKDINAPLDNLTPFFHDFKGTIVADPPDQTVSYTCTGVFEIKNDCILITELPPRTWSNPYYEWLSCANISYIQSIDQRSSKLDVNILIKCKPGTDFTTKNLVDDLKLSCKITLAYMNLFNHEGILTKYNNTADIIRHHAKIRLETYAKRINHQVKEMEIDVNLFLNKARFLKEVAVDKKIKPWEMKSDALRSLLRQLNYYEYENMNYLVKMEIDQLTQDQVEKMNKLAVDMQNNLDRLRKTTPNDVWILELNQLEKAYDDYVVELNEQKTTKSAKDTVSKKKRKS